MMFVKEILKVCSYSSFSGDVMFVRNRILSSPPLLTEQIGMWATERCMSLFLQGYVVRISGGNDKQGFPMKQGVLTHGRVRLLLSKGHSCYRPRRTGERKRKSVRGCIVDANLSVLNLVIVKKGKMKQSVERIRHLEWTCLLVAVKFCRIQTLNINHNSLNAYLNSFWALYCNL